MILSASVNNIENGEYLTIIPRARMGYESKPMRPSASWAIDSEAMRARGIIVNDLDLVLEVNFEPKCPDYTAKRFNLYRLVGESRRICNHSLLLY